MTVSIHISHPNQHDLIVMLEEMNGLISQLKSISSEHFLPLNKTIKQYDQWVVDSTKANKSKQWSGIITALQYHDIIRQRLEHIEEIHASCIHEFRHSSSLSPLEQTDYIRFLPKIVELNGVQLQATNEEFQRVARDLEGLFTQLEHKMEENHSLPDHCARSAADFHATITLATEKLQHLGTNVNSTYSTHELPLHLEHIYTMESERMLFYQVFNMSHENRTSSTTNDTVDLF